MRLFIAVSFPADVLRDVNDRVARIRTRLPPASWVRPEAQHLTFAFLGEQPESSVGRICELAEVRLQSVPRFSARLDGCGFFPNSRHGRVAWIGVAPEENLGAVAKSVRQGVAEAGVALDNVDFRPHLTLCRIRDHWPPASIDLFNKTFAGVASEPFEIDHVTLYSSQLDPSGAIHSAIHTLKLG